MLRLVSGAVALATALLIAVPAHAATGSLEDPAGDTDSPGLDITAATLRSGNHRIVVDVAFVRSVRGDLVVSVDPRFGRGLRMISEHRPRGTTRDFLLPRAFTDGPSDHLRRAERCRGFRVEWSADEPTARLVLPRRCLHGGEYDEVRFSVLTERGADTDYAPDTRRGASGWILRG